MTLEHFRKNNLTQEADIKRNGLNFEIQIKPVRIIRPGRRVVIFHEKILRQEDLFSIFIQIHSQYIFIYSILLHYPRIARITLHALKAI